MKETEYYSKLAVDLFQLPGGKYLSYEKGSVPIAASAASSERERERERGGEREREAAKEHAKRALETVEFGHEEARAGLVLCVFDSLISFACVT